MEASDARDTRFGAWFPAFLLVLAGVWHEICIRQTDAYLGPGLSTPRWQSLAIAAICGILGVWGGRRALLRVERRAALIGALAALVSVVSCASGAIWFFGFTSKTALAVIGIALPAVTSLVCGAAIGALGQAGALAYAELGSLRLLLGPLGTVAAAFTLVALLTLASYLGLWRAAVGVGLLTAWFAGSVGAQRHYLSALDRPSSVPAVIASSMGIASLIAAQAFAPARLTSLYPSELVWCDKSGETVVISAQNTFELFEGPALRTSSADAYRFAELAVHPLLTAAPTRTRVLVLGPGGGFLEREVLRYAEVREVVSVNELDTTAFRASAWPAHEGVLVDPRLRFVTAEPLPWLEEHPEKFDAIVVSLSLPQSHHEGKHATRYFFRLLRERLTPRGLVALEAAPLVQAPRTFASTWRSLTEAGFAVASYEAPVPLLGALSFLIGTPTDFRNQPRKLPDQLRFLSQLPTLSTQPPAEAAEPSTLDHQRAVGLWHQEQAALGN